MTNNVIKKVYKNGVEYQIYGSAGAAGAGDVTGPSSSTNGHLAVFDGTTGKIIKDGGAIPSTSDCVKTSGNQTIAGTKTFSTSPVVPSKSTDAANTATAIATEAQVYKKQDKLTTQTAYTTKGTATKVPTITTNTLGQVTAISETNITFPVTSVNGSTGAVTGLQTTSNLKTSLTDNSDSYYPSQKAVKTAVDGKQATLVSGTNIKTVNGNSLLGSGDLTISGGISNDTTGTTSTVTGIWAGSETEYTNLGTKSGTVLYFTF